MTTISSKTLAGFAAAVVAWSALAEPAEEFRKEIRPILEKHCFECHGPAEDTRQADLRLDQQEAVAANRVIVPGRPDESELIRRISSNDAAEVMPPADSGMPGFCMHDAA